ncbi:hypothetical protein BK673_03160 [Pseudomonas fluorescens]|jgi:hypothetical protein|uniref:Uncharacterized protein n=1 Tax=Pseudomonas fluorescens TaxID=294 RepID=A0A423PBE5_PSEFL|nr:hypothetical protein BK673_03160 [Pseudomonas fluorescens]
MGLAAAEWSREAQVWSARRLAQRVQQNVPQRMAPVLSMLQRQPVLVLVLVLVLEQVRQAHESSADPHAQPASVPVEPG